MDEYAEIYFLDGDDVRNATRDHRTQRPTGVAVGRPRPAAGGTGVVVRQPATWVRDPARIPQGYVVQGTPARQGLFGNLSTGEIVEIAAQVFAALAPLPAAPVATTRVETDVGNLILFQNALANHAKRDEQLRTIGGLIAKLVG